ncbi:hypothetical protein LSH36_458g00002 [Paralvinella palmiformis]|uniref:Uncharacterized protein n=1 Tax=Paralvinella palmiformis TaxID=53620 RepID=A0AAD9JB04_9ANNE|nr:hypothetical protein LSH36_458g00002 [Paralvinella palmiformis]
MPFLESDSPNTVTSMDVEDGCHPRTSSFGIRNIFRKRNKSGDSASGDPRMPNSKGSTPSPVTTPNSKTKNFSWGSLSRPRSRSDASASRDVPPVGVHRKHSISEETVDSTKESLSHPDVRTHYGSHPTPMSHLLSPPASRTRHASECTNRSIGPEEFIEMYRSRAYSDPRPQNRSAALAAARRKRISSDSSDDDVFISPPASPKNYPGHARRVGQSPHNPSDVKAMSSLTGDDSCSLPAHVLPPREYGCSIGKGPYPGVRHWLDSPTTMRRQAAQNAYFSAGRHAPVETSFFLWEVKALYCNVRTCPG